MRASVRRAGAAVALAATLLVSGCGSDGGTDGAEPERTARESTEAAGPTGGGAADEEGGVDGTWSSGDGGDALVLSVGDGQAALLGATACTGTVSTDADPITLDLTCGDGSSDHTEGTVRSVDGEELTIEWGSGTTDTFTRIEIPTEFPSETPVEPPTDLDPELPTE
ncbi:hypothetical protein F0L17_15455 [Streptomyces sp. TRM43335]|uniref:Lipoprotein n=1 Tax=Streptomyces taklimakanensis TaxID=2569853 RepID=A0A6G2BEH3_9ACTN|nr:hypothetical protein [Streptomyces taklimakanensis]MTE20479.1 hypothetical protein [Streptomyces taklimakanensis]